jgi:uncharacterized membrane protein YfcA
MEWVFLCGFAFVAGFVDAVVGGGGLIQIPALFLWLPPAQAALAVPVLGTNKLSSICGTTMAVVQYARRVPLPAPILWPAALSACLFSFVGARVVTLVQPQALRPLVLVLLVAVAVYTFVRRDFGSLHAPQLSPRAARNAGLLTGAVIGFYDGFFGPGTGSFLIFVFVGVFGFGFLGASASAKVVNLATNLSAVAWFAASGNILYRYALPMGACNILGSLLGARLAILKGNRFVRTFFLVVVSAMILRFGWEVLSRR